MPQLSDGEKSKIQSTFEENMKLIGSLGGSLSRAYALQGPAIMPTLDSVTSDAMKQVEENYKQIGTLQSAAAASLKEVQDNYNKIGTLDEAGKKAQEQVQENYNKIGTLQAAAANAQKQVIANLQKAGFSSGTVFANAFTTANKPVPDSCKEAGNLLDEICMAGLDYQQSIGASLGNLITGDPQASQDINGNQIEYEEKINAIFDKYHDHIDDIEKLASDINNLPGPDTNNPPTLPDCTEIRSNCQTQIDICYTNEKDRVEQCCNNDTSVDISGILKSLENVKTEYSARIDQIMGLYQGQIDNVKKAGYDFTNPETLKDVDNTLDNLKKEYQDKIDETLADYKDQLEKSADLLAGRPISTMADLLNLPPRELLARTIYGEQTQTGGQNEVAWNIINKSRGDIASVLKPTIYSCLKGEGGNTQSYSPDVNSDGWKNALDLADKIMAGETDSIPNTIGNTTEFRTESDFNAKSSTKTDANGNNVTYYKQLGTDNVVHDFKVKDIVYKGGNVFFNFDYSP